MSSPSPAPCLHIAFAKSETELRLVFSTPVDPSIAQDPAAYQTRSGLKVLHARVDDDDPTRVTLTTEPMNGEAMDIDVVRTPSIITTLGERLVKDESPEFIHGIASIPEIQRPAIDRFPFASRFVGKNASGSCGKDGGVDSNVLIDTFGFAFIHMQNGGPFNSLKIVTDKHIPGIAEAARALSPGLTVHVLWAGGEIRNVNGENQLVDTGFMEGSIITPNPLPSPPPFPVTCAELSGPSSKERRAKSLHAVIVRFSDVTIDRVSPPDRTGQRRARISDGSGGGVSAVILSNVKTALHAGQRLSALRGLIHQPREGEIEAIVELDEHLVPA